MLLGRPHGFECTTQGTLFFDVARIIAAKRPKAFLLENVKNLVSHDKRQHVQGDKGNARKRTEISRFRRRSSMVSRFVPQHRERILIVGFREQTGFSFDDFQTTCDGAEAWLDPSSGRWH